MHILVPCFDYCCTVWGNTMSPKSDLNKINKIQKRAARIILNKPLKTSSSDMFNKLKWLKFENRCAYHTGLLIFKCQHQLVPEYLTELLTFSKNTRYRLRSSERNDLRHHKPRTNYMKNSFSYTSIDIWNKIPLEIRNISSISSFKYKYKNFLFQKQQQLSTISRI
jgi:hypothetical protein